MCCCDFSVASAVTSVAENQREELASPLQESPAAVKPHVLLAFKLWRNKEKNQEAPSAAQPPSGKKKKKKKRRLRPEESASAMSGKSNYCFIFLNYNTKIFHSRHECLGGLRREFYMSRISRTPSTIRTA